MYFLFQSIRRKIWKVDYNSCKHDSHEDDKVFKYMEEHRDIKSNIHLNNNRYNMKGNIKNHKNRRINDESSPLTLGQATVITSHSSNIYEDSNYSNSSSDNHSSYDSSCNSSSSTYVSSSDSSYSSSSSSSSYDYSSSFSGDSSSSF